MSVEVLFRMADTTTTAQYWRWLDDPDNPDYVFLDVNALDDIQLALNEALINPQEGETGQDAVARAFTTGPLRSPDTEKEWSQRLTELAFPLRLARKIQRRTNAGQHITLRVLPSPRLASVPWELMVMPDGRRLIEHVTIRLDAPAVVNSGRGRMPEPWDTARHREPLRLFEPVTGRRTGVEADVVIGNLASGKIQDSVYEPVHPVVSRIDLSKLLHGRPSAELAEEFPLKAPPSRLVYYGHAGSDPEAPGSAMIMLSDPAQIYGKADPGQDPHRPFSALDLLLGTIDVSPQHRDKDLTYPHPEAVEGHHIWPMPPRVALIACESGADHRAMETFGLVMAMLNAGAELVTSTRWTLPTDNAFSQHLQDAHQAVTTELALTVDEAHDQNDPVTHLRQWQLGKLTTWQTKGHLADTPLVWAALTTHIAPRPRSSPGTDTDP